MRVDARDVKIHSSVEHVDFAVGQEVGQILLHNMGSTVIAAGEAAQQLATAVMPPRDRLALEHDAAQGVPGRGRNVFATEGTRDWHVVQRGEAKTKASHDCGAEVGVDGERRGGLHPSLGGLVPARGETNHVRIGALRALKEGVETVVEDLLGQRALQAFQLADAIVV